MIGLVKRCVSNRPFDIFNGFVIGFVDRISTSGRLMEPASQNLKHILIVKYIRNAKSRRNRRSLIDVNRRNQNSKSRSGTLNDSNIMSKFESLFVTSVMLADGISCEKSAVEISCFQLANLPTTSIDFNSKS